MGGRRGPADRGRRPAQRGHASAAVSAAVGLVARTSTSQLYLKDETTHITGSLKHRLARSLFLYALCNGWIGENTTVIEASSGSTAVSEAYFAALLGLPFIAVMPASTSAAKIALIESQGGRCHFVDESAQVYAEAERLAEETGGHYLDQFTNAERATDWRGNNNIAESIFDADGRRGASGAGVDRGRCGHRRHQRDHRPLHPLSPPRHPVVRRRSGELGVLPRLRAAAQRRRDG